MPAEPSELRKRVLAALLIAPKSLSWLMKNMQPNDAKQMTNLMGNLRHAGYALIESNFWKLTHLGIEHAKKHAAANGTTEGAATTVRDIPDDALPTGSAASGGAAPDPDDVLRRMLKTPPVTLADVARKHRSTRATSATRFLCR